MSVILLFDYGNFTHHHHANVDSNVSLQIRFMDLLHECLQIISITSFKDGALK